jgi:hypothetical protein
MDATKTPATRSTYLFASLIEVLRVVQWDFTICLKNAVAEIRTWNIGTVI